MSRILVFFAAFFLILPLTGLADDKKSDNDAVVEKGKEHKHSGKGDHEERNASKKANAEKNRAKQYKDRVGERDKDKPRGGRNPSPDA